MNPGKHKNPGMVFSRSFHINAWTEQIRFILESSRSLFVLRNSSIEAIGSVPICTVSCNYGEGLCFIASTCPYCSDMVTSLQTLR